MSDPFHNYSLFGQGVNDTIGLLALGNSCTINPNHVGVTNSVNGNGSIDVSLSLNSAAHCTSQHQIMPAQLSLHHHLGEGRMRRTNLMVPCGARTPSTCDPQPMQPLNINILVGHNSSVNINLLNNNPAYQFTKTNLCASSSGMARSSREPFLTLASSQEPFPEQTSKITNSCQLNECHSQYTSLATALRSQALRTCFPNYSREIPTAKSNQGQPCQNLDFQSNSNLSVFHLQSRYFHNNKPQHFPYLPCPEVNPPEIRGAPFDGGNAALHEEELYSPTNLLTYPKSGPVTDEASDQASQPSSKNSCFLLSNQNTLSQAPPTNNTMVGPQGNLGQVFAPNHSIDLDARAQSRRRSARRHISYPYTKYGPYTCPHCQGVFDNGYIFAAHVQNHYKDESHEEQMKRREVKIRKRDLRIAQSTSGITIIPESFQLGKKLLVPSNTNGDKATIAKQRDGFADLKVKEELKDEVN